MGEAGSKKVGKTVDGASAAGARAAGAKSPLAAAAQISVKVQGRIKAVLFVLALLPLARLVWGAATGSGLGANPVEYITRDTGTWALIFLCITLAVTPLRRITQWHWLIKLRRMLGLYMFFYALLHFMTFIWFDHFFDLAEIVKDIIKRPFITVGFAAFVLLVPLAATSTNRMIRLIGGKRWQLLHKLIYLIAGLAILHYWWMRAGKHNFANPILYGAIIAVLLGFRVFEYLRKRKAAPQAAVSASTPRKLVTAKGS